MSITNLEDISLLNGIDAHAGRFLITSKKYLKKKRMACGNHFLNLSTCIMYVCMYV